MASEGALVGFVALSAPDLKAFNDSGELRPGIFCAPGVKGRYVPLDPTVEGAIETALMQSTAAAYEVAERDTTWYVLKVSFSDEALVAMFRAKELSWGEKLHRLRLLTSIKVEWLMKKAQTNVPQVELVEVPLSQMSMDDWGDRVLKTKLTVPATCQQCSQNDRCLWRAAHGSGGGYYCAECWHAHGKQKVLGSLHELEQQRLKARELHSKKSWTARSTSPAAEEPAEDEEAEASNATPAQEAPDQLA